MGISLVESASTSAEAGEVCQQQKARWADLSDEESCDEEQYAMRRQRTTSKKKWDMEKKTQEMQKEALESVSNSPQAATVAPEDPAPVKRPRAKTYPKTSPNGAMKWCVKANRSTSEDAGTGDVQFQTAEHPRKWSEESKETRGKKGSGKGQASSCKKKGAVGRQNAGPVHRWH
mmetsp:Transcript_81081/g.142970  ORF Transcript_81081/g.142970 Transcript_81081/m.142970 type:complete len:174 (-) Transcript_81081:379-900(-)